MNRTNFYYAGIASGLLVGILFVAITQAIKKKRHMNGNFDERQELARGKAFTYGFTAMLIYIPCYSLFADITGFSFEDNLTSGLLSILVGLAVVVITCIWKDAYFTLQEKASHFVVLDLLLMFTNFANGYDHLKHPERGTSIAYFNFALAFLFLLILINMGLKAIYEKRREEME